MDDVENALVLWRGLVEDVGDVEYALVLLDLVHDEVSLEGATRLDSGQSEGRVSPTESPSSIRSATPLDLGQSEGRVSPERSPTGVLDCHVLGEDRAST